MHCFRLRLTAEYKPIVFMTNTARATIPQALEELRQGRMIILVDNESRENEGDLVVAAQFATPEMISFMAKEGRGLICLALTQKRCEELSLKPMVEKGRNQNKFGTNFTVSIEAKAGVTTGISAYDRSRTILAAIDPEKTGDDLVSPGHVFPLQAKELGVLERPGQTEGSVDLASLAGLNPSAVICEIMNDHGSMARMPELEVFAKKHHLKIATIDDLIVYRLQNEDWLDETPKAKLPTERGSFEVIGFKSKISEEEAVVLIKGKVNTDLPILVRIHSACLTGDVFFSKRCDCKRQLHKAIEQINEEGSGVIIYLPKHEGRGIGIFNKLKAYALQDQGFDTVEANLELGFSADLREYDLAAKVLLKLGIAKVRLMTNNPRKINGLAKLGIEVVNRVPLKVPVDEKVESYLWTKQQKMEHQLELEID